MNNVLKLSTVFCRGHSAINNLSLTPVCADKGQEFPNKMQDPGGAEIFCIPHQTCPVQRQGMSIKFSERFYSRPRTCICTAY